MKNRYITYVFITVLIIAGPVLYAQQNNNHKRDSGIQISVLDLTETAPEGYVAIKTVKLNTPLRPDSIYELGFWIFGPQPKVKGYSFPIQVFPSNRSDLVEPNIFDLVSPTTDFPKLEMKPPPSYTSKGHFTFVIRPDTLYHYMTIALRAKNSELPPIQLKSDITVTGIFVRPLPEIKEEETEDTTESIAESTVPLPAVRAESAERAERAERKLINSNKSYSVAERELSIGLFDHRNIDNDRVTIYLNDDILVKDLTLKKQKQFFKATLRPGKNTITLHAENLGEVAPNTAAILIKNQSQEFMAVLESDLGASQFFTLIYNPD